MSAHVSYNMKGVMLLVVCLLVTSRMSDGRNSGPVGYSLPWILVMGDPSPNEKCTLKLEPCVQGVGGRAK